MSVEVLYIPMGHEFSIPEQHQGVKWETCIYRDLNYLKMCRFFTYPMYDLFRTHPDLQKFKYYFRIDLDAHFVAPVPFDVFQYMKAGGIDYVTHHIAGDKEQCTIGLRDAVLQYFLDEKGQRASLLAALNVVVNNTIFYGNFGAGNLAFFRSEKYLLLAKHVTDDLDGYYKHRWCDQDLYPLALSILGGRVARLGVFDGFCTFHGTKLVGLDGLDNYSEFPAYLVNTIG